ncbi:class II histone deacetylase, partial [Klebsiella pneumoniae]|nr:class II histone deacetylase [Klebsiella pneumoniae]
IRTVVLYPLLDFIQHQLPRAPFALFQRQAIVGVAQILGLI